LETIILLECIAIQANANYTNQWRSQDFSMGGGGLAGIRGRGLAGIRGAEYPAAADPLASCGWGLRQRQGGLEAEPSALHGRFCNI